MEMSAVKAAKEKWMVILIFMLWKKALYKVYCGPFSSFPTLKQKVTGFIHVNLYTVHQSPTNIFLNQFKIVH